jgi:hypothetical protein
MRKPDRYLIAFVTIASLNSASAADLAKLPVRGTTDRPVLLLELGTNPDSIRSAGSDLTVTRGEVASQDAGITSQSEADEVISRHSGFGQWATTFRFQLKSAASNQPYFFHARWRQGGEPSICEQTFAVWAGPDKDHLQPRAEFKLRPKGWEYAWIAADAPVNIKPDDTIIEIRNSGAGHDTKVFDAFLLGPPPPPFTLPIAPEKNQPAVLLDLGKSPKSVDAAKPDGLQVLAGKLTGHSGTGGPVEEKDEIQVLHPGFGQWGAKFRFELIPAIAPGQYRFQARYKSGGEVSQVAQTFTIKSGESPESLAQRASFTLTNTTPWEYQWVTAAGTLPIFPGDRYLEIENAGKADGAKVFDAFLLQLDTPLQGGMTAQDAALRNRFLAAIKPVDHPDRRLYVLDRPNGPASALFAGLADKMARPVLEKMQVNYLLGAEAEAMAHALNLTTLPAALITDTNYALLGSLTDPATAAETTRFLADPQRHGKQPSPHPVADEQPRPLRDGVPEAWLVGGFHEGIAGLSIYGVDSETVLRPNPEQTYLSTEMMGGKLRSWQKAATQPDGTTAITESVDHDLRWSGGTGYAQLYLHADAATLGKVQLHFAGTAAGWLDGHEITVGQNAELTLSAGWHSLLLKLITHTGRGQRLDFAARFTDLEGKPLPGIQTRTSDPIADLALARWAGKLRPLLYIDAPANLAHPGDALKLRLDMRWHPIEQDKALSVPIPRFAARLHAVVKDYSGNTVAVREQQGIYPSETSLDLGKAPAPGYYSVYTSLHGSDGRLIMAYPADGFSVIGSHAAQKARLARKKLWNNFYYAFAEGDRGFQRPNSYFDWLEQMGIFQSFGSYPGFQPGHQAQWEQVHRRGLNVFADTGGDSHWLNDAPDSVRDYVAQVAPHTRYFKANNEIDTRRGGEWAKLRSPAHWVERAKREHDLIHRARPDGHYVGGSLVKPADTGDNAGYPDKLGPGRWFEQVLKLGLDQHVDAWDVHAYPQKPPRFDGPIGNAETEDERGVLATYARLGRNNNLPFWLGEAGAKAAHGITGRRWQAEQAAKMIAWVNSRPDYLGIAFCLAHEYDLGQGRLWDYSMGHKPAEAALYTAGALIDGLAYRKFEGTDSQIQAAWFGPTLMAWRIGGKHEPWSLKLDAAKEWVLVDVVGRIEPLTVGKDGRATVSLDESPLYVLPRTEYRQLVRSD